MRISSFQYSVLSILTLAVGVAIGVGAAFRHTPFVEQPRLAHNSVVTGVLLSRTDSQMTIELPDTSQVTFSFSATTTFSQYIPHTEQKNAPESIDMQASPSDFLPGDLVAIVASPFTPLKAEAVSRKKEQSTPQ